MFRVIVRVPGLTKLRREDGTVVEVTLPSNLPISELENSMRELKKWLVRNHTPYNLDTPAARRMVVGLNPLIAIPAFYTFPLHPFHLDISSLV